MASNGFDFKNDIYARTISINTKPSINPLNNIHCSIERTNLNGFPVIVSNKLAIIPKP